MDRNTETYRVSHSPQGNIFKTAQPGSTALSQILLFRIMEFDWVNDSVRSYTPTFSRRWLILAPEKLHTVSPEGVMSRNLLDLLVMQRKFF